MPVVESRSQGSTAGGTADSREAIIGPNEYWRIHITSSIGKSVKMAIKDVSDVCYNLRHKTAGFRSRLMDEHLGSATLAGIFFKQLDMKHVVIGNIWKRFRIPIYDLLR